MNLKVFKPTKGDIPAALDVDGATIYFLGGEPVAYLHAGELRLSACITFENFRLAFPAAVEALSLSPNTVPEREVETRLLFRDRESNRLLHGALGAMPFGAMAHFELGGGAMNFEQIAGNVEALRVVLLEHAERDKARDAELEDYSRAVAGAGAFLRLAGFSSLLEAPEVKSAAAEREHCSVCGVVLTVLDVGRFDFYGARACLKHEGEKPPASAREDEDESRL